MVFDYDNVLYDNDTHLNGIIQTNTFNQLKSYIGSLKDIFILSEGLKGNTAYLTYCYNDPTTDTHIFDLRIDIIFSGVEMYLLMNQLKMVTLVHVDFNVLKDKINSDFTLFFNILLKTGSLNIFKNIYILNSVNYIPDTFNEIISLNLIQILILNEARKFGLMPKLLDNVKCPDNINGIKEYSHDLFFINSCSCLSNTNITSSITEEYIIPFSKEIKNMYGYACIYNYFYCTELFKEHFNYDIFKYTIFPNAEKVRYADIVPYILTAHCIMSLNNHQEKGDIFSDGAAFVKNMGSYNYKLNEGMCIFAAYILKFSQLSFFHYNEDSIKLMYPFVKKLALKYNMEISELVRMIKSYYNCLVENKVFF